RVRPVMVQQPIVAPAEGGIDDDALRHRGGVISAIEGKICPRRADSVGEIRIRPPQRTVESLRVRIQQQLVMVEPVPASGIVWSVNAITVERPGYRFGKISVPYLIGVLRKLNASQLATSLRVEKAEFDLFGVLGKE